MAGRESAKQTGMGCKRLGGGDRKEQTRSNGNQSIFLCS